MREYNHAHDSRLHIWSYRRRDETSLAPPIIVRFTIRDVFTVYVTLDTAADGSLVTESAAAFGPREKVGIFQAQYLHSMFSGVDRVLTLLLCL